MDLSLKADATLIKEILDYTEGLVVPFVKEPIGIKDYKDYKLIKMIRKVIEGDDSVYNDSIFDELWHPITYLSGIYKAGGWSFNFDYKWNYYIVNKTQYDDSSNFIKQKAPSVKFIYDHSIDANLIEDIILLPSSEDKKYIIENVESLLDKTYPKDDDPFRVEFLKKLKEIVGIYDE